MKKIRQKTALKAVLFATGLAVSMLSYTAPAGLPDHGSKSADSVSKAITNLDNTIAKLPSEIASGISNSIGNMPLEQFLQTIFLQDAFNYLQTYDHISDPGITSIKTLNMATANINNQSLSPSKVASNAAQTATANNITNSLRQFVYAMNPTDTDLMNAEGEKFSTYMNANSAAQLALAIKADDTLYVQDPASKASVTYMENRALLEKPTEAEKQNDVLDFSSLLAPTFYTTQQTQAAQQYVKYVTGNTRRLTKGINFQALYKQPAALLNLKKTEAYQDYVLNMRSLIALRSVEVSLLNTLIAERTPITGLATSAGITYSANAPGVASDADIQSGNASPLQIADYRASHRIEDSNWYANVQNDNPAAVQRNILYVLAEIEQQNYQAHLDRERLLAAMTVSAIQFNMEISKTAETTAVTTLNAAINCAINPSSKSC